MKNNTATQQTDYQKLRILLKHRNLFKFEYAFLEAQRNYNLAVSELQKELELVFKELGLDDGKYSYNLDTLEPELKRIIEPIVKE